MHLRDISGCGTHRRMIPWVPTNRCLKHRQVWWRWLWKHASIEIKRVPDTEFRVPATQNTLSLSSSIYENWNRLLFDWPWQVFHYLCVLRYLLSTGHNTQHPQCKGGELDLGSERFSLSLPGSRTETGSGGPSGSQFQQVKSVVIASKAEMGLEEKNCSVHGSQEARREGRSCEQAHTLPAHTLLTPLTRLHLLQCIQSTVTHEWTHESAQCPVILHLQHIWDQEGILDLHHSTLTVMEICGREVAMEAEN